MYALIQLSRETLLELGCHNIEAGVASASGTSSGIVSRAFECIFALSSAGTFRFILQYRGLV